jgi:Tol biopolymer transport system component
VGRSGRDLGTVGEPASIRGVELSPDGRRAAIHIEDNPGRGDIWVVDLDRATTSRLTFDPQQHNHTPVWSRDGASVLFAKRGTFDIYAKNASGAGQERVVYRLMDRTQNFVYPLAIHPDLETLVIGTSRNGGDLLTAPLAGGAASPFATTRAQEMFAQLSPDGRWLAYQSDESGQPQVFVRSFPSGEAKYQASTIQGVRPRWRADGRELYYLQAVAASGPPLVAVSVEPAGQGLVLGTPEPLFPFQANAGGGHDGPTSTYAPSPDGQRFLVVRPSTGGGNEGLQTPLTVVLNWQAGLP